jgi:capsular polysaccharide transport system permease protein
MSLADVQQNLRITTQVLGAILLRNMRTRFGGSYQAYVIAILWPYSHLVIIVVAYTILGRIAPLGTDTVTYFAISLAPFILYSYTMRGISSSIIANRPLLHFPRVKVLDILFARVLLESITACVICFIVMVSLIVFGFEFEPFDYAQMLAGFAGGLYFGVAVGIAWGLVCGIVPGAAYLTNIWIVTFWVSSGIFFLPDSLPNQLQYWLSYIPLMHAVELARVGYYPDFHSTILDVSYLFWYSTGLIGLSLVTERALRKYVLSQ